MRRWLTLLVVAIVAAGCSGGDDPPASSGSPSASATGGTATGATAISPSASASPEDSLATPTIDGTYEVADGRSLAIGCWGDGPTTVVLETGHPTPGGIADFGGSDFLRALADSTRVCAYDRGGTGGSDEVPNEPRTADDVVDELDTLLAEAAVPGPYVLVGTSFGGMAVTHYADKHPEDVAGVVLVDVPAPSAELSTEEIPEIAWDHPENPEHLDIVPEFEGRFARDPARIEAPLVVITATAGDSDVTDQAVWLASSPDAQQVELEGGHDLWLDDPDAVAAEILELAGTA